MATGQFPICLSASTSGTGKLYPNDRPGLGVTADMAQLKMIGEVTAPGPSRLYYRPDGSLTHW